MDHKQEGSSAIAKELVAKLGLSPFIETHWVQIAQTLAKGLQSTDEDNLVSLFPAVNSIIHVGSTRLRLRDAKAWVQKEFSACNENRAEFVMELLMLYSLVEKVQAEPESDEHWGRLLATIDQSIARMLDAQTQTVGS